jgi:DNA/RNA endonuclease YhcR with UshA esterase domain
MFIFTILDNDAPVVVTGPPTRTIAEIRGANTGNQADSVGKSFRIYGTVYGLNQRLTSNGGGYQMFFRDATGGIGIFKNDTVSGITSLNEGDSLRIMGKIECFRGLSQVNLDSMVVLATGRPLKAADLVSSIGESSESNLVKMDGLVINPATWTTGLGVGGFTAKAFNGTDTIAIRIDNDCELYNQPAPTGTVSITGMVGQFVPGNPLPVAPFPASGYQLIPRRASDIAASNPGGKPKIRFSPISSTITESASNQTVTVLISQAPSVAVEASVYVKGGTASAGTDYTNDTLSVNMGPGLPLTLDLPMAFLDDAVQEPVETLTLVIRKKGLVSDTAFDLSPDSIFTFTINDNDVPAPPTLQTLSIAQIRGANTGNQADSVGKSYRIYGTIYGLNQRLSTPAGGYQMFIRDATGGIGIFKNAPISGISALNEGDSIKVMGKIECFRGLSQINPDSMVILATGVSLKSPDLVTSLSENEEANLVKMVGLVINPATWTTGLGGGGFTAKAFNGTDTIAIRIDNDCDLYNQPVPNGTVNVTGMVGQFVGGNPAPVAPFPSTGYQLIPRRASDVVVTTALNPSCHCYSGLTVVPNPGTDFISISGNGRADVLQISDLRGRLLLELKGLESMNRINVSSLADGMYLLKFPQSGQLVRWVKTSAR